MLSSLTLIFLFNLLIFSVLFRILLNFLHGIFNAPKLTSRKLPHFVENLETAKKTHT